MKDPGLFYCDTNILSRLANNRSEWQQVVNFLNNENLILCVSSAQLAELADATRQHVALSELFSSVPSGIIKERDEVIKEEVAAHPKMRTDPLLISSYNQPELHDKDIFLTFLSSPSLANARIIQQQHAQMLASRHSQLKANYPPQVSGKYTPSQADEFAFCIVMQWLAGSHRSFLQQFQDNVQNFNSEIFLSIRIYAQVLFYKYYIGRREVTRTSDFGDLAHLYALPYCQVAVMERDICNILNQIKRNHNTLTGTAIYNTDFIGNLSQQP